MTIVHTLDAIAAALDKVKAGDLGIDAELEAIRAGADELRDFTFDEVIPSELPSAEGADLVTRDEHDALALRVQELEPVEGAETEPGGEADESTTGATGTAGADAGPGGADTTDGGAADDTLGGGQAGDAEPVLVEASDDDVRLAIMALDEISPAIQKTHAGVYRIEDVNDALKIAGFLPITALRRDRLSQPAE